MDEKWKRDEKSDGERRKKELLLERKEQNHPLLGQTPSVEVAVRSIRRLNIIKIRENPDEKYISSLIGIINSECNKLFNAFSF